MKGNIENSDRNIAPEPSNKDRIIFIFGWEGLFLWIKGTFPIEHSKRGCQHFRVWKCGSWESWHTGCYPWKKKCQVSYWDPSKRFMLQKSEVFSQFNGLQMVKQQTGFSLLGYFFPLCDSSHPVIRRTVKGKWVWSVGQLAKSSFHSMEVINLLTL